MGRSDFADLERGGVIHSINPTTSAGDISGTHAEKLYKRITGKVRENRKKISTVQKFRLDDAGNRPRGFQLTKSNTTLDAMETARKKKG